MYVPSSSSEQIADTLEFFPIRFRMPASSALDKATQAANDLVATLSEPSPASPFFAFGDEQQNALRKLANIFKVSLNPASSLPRVPDPTPLNMPSPSLPRVDTASPSPTVVSPPLQHNIQPTTSFKPNHPYNTRLQRQLTQQQHQMNHALAHVQHQVNPVLDPKSGKLLEYRDLIKGKDKIVWEKGMSNEIGRLADGVGTRMPHGTNTISFIKFHEIPKNKRPTYAQVVSEFRPHKPDPYRIRITAGGNLIVYLDDKSQPTSDIVTAKILLNSVISTPNAKFLGLDIKNMYLHSGLPEPEFMRIPRELVPDKIINQYNLHDHFHKWIFILSHPEGNVWTPTSRKTCSRQTQKTS